MAKKTKKGDSSSGNILFANEVDTINTQKNNKGIDEPNIKNGLWLSLGRGERIGVVIVSFLLVAGALGATGIGSSVASVFSSNKSKQSNNQATGSGSSLMAKMNPLAPVDNPAPTPQLSKEYIYAGSRMLAVEDANANAAPPTDLAVWRPSNGTWFVINSSNQQWTTGQWGSNGDIPVQGDYDGDGKTDFAIFKPSNSYWWISYSSNGNYTNFPFGQSGDIPIGATFNNGSKTDAADFDGDGKTDAAVFRPYNGYGYWYYFRSSDNVFFSLQFGLSSDKPTPKDFDGDGKADIAVWRPSDQTFYALRSYDSSVQSGQAGATGQIGSGDTPVPADYDGDGKADYAERHGADWQVKQSSNGQTQTATWQQAADKEVQNDYDGDGKVDIAVWRDSTGMWYIRQSHDNSLRQVQWGASGDTPVPAFYRR